jgi:hypothetical protein
MASVVERAFQLAKSGKCSSPQEVIKVLKQEGFSNRELEQLVGGSIRKQLREIIARRSMIVFDRLKDEMPRLLPRRGRLNERRGHARNYRTRAVSRTLF